MKIPKGLETLVENGLIDEVVKSLTSGKEADVFVVYSQGEYRCAKVYKESHVRSFKKQAAYQEGRKVGNSRKARAMEKRSKYGRKEIDTEWQNAEVSALYKLAEAGVSVPQPYYCMDGVLLMQLIVGEDGDVAPRLIDLDLDEETALDYFSKLILDIMLMLCAGVVHGDLSEYNVLVDDYGPIIIDLPQAVDAATNNNAGEFLIRDVKNLRDYFSRFVPGLKATNYGKEMWDLYKEGDLTPDSVLTGKVKRSTKDINLRNVLGEIEDARTEAEEAEAQVS